MRRRAPWLLLGLLLLVIGAWLMPSIDPSAERRGRERAELQFPRYPDADDYEVMRKRRTLPALPRPETDAGDNSDSDSRPQKRDPLLVALPPRGDLLVFEASAFLKSPIGRMMTECLAEKGDVPTVERDGFDLASFERIAIGNPSDDHRIIAIAGKVGRDRIPTQHREKPPRPYGDHGQLYGGAGAESGPEVFAIWNDELTLVSDDEAEIRAAIDRLEGRRQEPSSFPPDSAYGEMYGRLGAEAAMALLPSALRDKLPVGDLQVELHADATQDVLVVADAYGTDPHSIDIGKTLAAALGAQRFQAAAEGDEELSALLDAFSVERAPDGFQLQAAFTQDFVERSLGECATRARRRQHAPDNSPASVAGSGG